MVQKGNMDKGVKKRDRTGTLLYSFYLIFLLAGVVIIVRIIQIQLFYEPNPEIADLFRPSTQKKPIEPVRGSILAYDGTLLASSTPLYQVVMDCAVQREAYRKKPELEAEWKSKARLLSNGLAQIYKDKSAQQYYNEIIRNRAHGVHYYKIGREIDHETLQKVKALPLFNEGRYKGGITVEQRDSRDYPYGTLARRTIGYVKDNNRANNIKIGLEGRFDDELHGKEGLKWMKMTDGRARIQNFDSSYVKPKDGLNLRTTLNVNIQDIADRALRTQITENPNIEGGCVIVMDVHTGAIRAMVNLLRDSTTRTLEESFNMAVGRAGEPGSVFKTATMMTLLEDGKVKFRDEIPTNHGIVEGYRYAADDHIRDYERNNGTDKISVLKGFEMSSNYVFRKLVVDNYASRPQDFVYRLKKYHLTEKYDFDIDGLVTPTCVDPKSKSWSPTDLGAVAVGYSVTVSPLQTLAFYNAIANNGRMMKPYLVESIEENGVVRKRLGPSVLNPSICSKATADSLTMALTRVTQEGTATRLKQARCTVAGKTGTSRIVLEPKDRPRRGNPYFDEYGRKKNQATFAGFFPAGNPKYSAIVVIYSYLSSGSFYGGTLPALAYREIVDNIYAMDSDYSERVRRSGSMPDMDDVKVELKNDGRVPDVKGLGVMDAVYAIENSGYSCTYDGVGHVRSQNPAAGTVYARGANVHLELK